MLLKSVDCSFLRYDICLKVSQHNNYLRFVIGTSLLVDFYPYSDKLLNIHKATAIGTKGSLPTISREEDRANEN